MKSITPEDIDALLPQTQCGLCGFKGCLPYAQAMANKEAPLNKCPPGGLPTLNALGKLLNQDITRELQNMMQQQKPHSVVSIREEECIGCMKCITACPVDAILGSAKKMHTVIGSECTGCELCIPVCPTDCIDVISLNVLPTVIDLATTQQRRMRFQAKNSRTKKEKNTKQTLSEQKTKIDKKNYIANALERFKKKNNPELT